MNSPRATPARMRGTGGWRCCSRRHGALQLFLRRGQKESRFSYRGQPRSGCGAVITMARTTSSKAAGAKYARIDRLKRSRWARAFLSSSPTCVSIVVRSPVLRGVHRCRSTVRLAVCTRRTGRNQHQAARRLTIRYDSPSLEAAATFAADGRPRIIRIRPPVLAPVLATVLTVVEDSGHSAISERKLRSRNPEELHRLELRSSIVCDTLQPGYIRCAWRSVRAGTLSDSGATPGHSGRRPASTSGQARSETGEESRPSYATKT